MKPIQRTVDDLLDDIGDPELRAQLARLHDKLEAEPSGEDEAAKPQRGKVLQLPLWPDARRGVPNSILRGALFAAIQGKDRQYLKGEFLAAQQGIEIRFTGMQLDQSDLDVWEQAVHLARQHPLGTQCHFTTHGFLQALGRPTGGDHHEWLKDVFRRLGGCFIEITQNRLTYGGSLLEFLRDEEHGRYVLSLNPKIMALYTAGWTATDWQQRQQLRRKPLALWLHGFYSSHAAPYPLSVDYLHKLSGSRTKAMWKFKQNLIQAHRELEAVGAIKSFEIQDGLVLVENVPSGSQQRHLRKSKSRKNRTRHTR